MLKKKSVYVYPKGGTDNFYLERSCSVWSLCDCDVKKLPTKLSEYKDALEDNKDVVILNWFEDRVGYSKRPTYELIRSMLYLFLVRVSFRKLIWVKHNFRPHGSDYGFQFYLIQMILNKISNVCVTHRRVDSISSVVLPHPNYDFPQEYIRKRKERDIPYLYFGKIKKYKAIDILLSEWPVDKNIMLAGACDSLDLENELKDIIRSRGLQVTWKNEFLSYEELCELIGRSLYVALPHKDDSMIVSGAYYHAISGGANVTVTKGNSYNDYLSNFVCVVGLGRV